MAKPAPVALDPGEPFSRAGARVVRVRAAELFAHADGVLDTDDIEGVHDMRVATRRLRAVLEIFRPCWAGGMRSEFRSALSDVKDLADALGERRDPDVHIEALRAFSAEVPEDQRPGVAALLLRFEERQVAANAVLAEALEHAERSHLHGRLIALADVADAA
jgi:CHAD domain-containing protein